MRKTIILIVILVATVSVNAQFKFGVGGGMNFTNISGLESGGATVDGSAGFNGGLIMEVKLPVELGIEADVLFSQQGFDINYTDQSFAAYSSENNLTYIDVPVVAKLYILKVISLQGGVQYSQLLGAKSKVEGFGESDVKDAFNAGYLSAVLGFGIDVSKLHFSTRYNFGVTNIDSGDTKSNMLTLTLGFWIKN